LPGLPVVSGKDLIRVFSKLDYRIVRQRGSHVQLKCVTPAGEHTITIPLHDEIATGTLNDILSKVAIWKGLSKDELIRMLGRR
jgi:predicted RNA binding protein YcfA (HicA-like mRNA interferase family)